MRMFVCCFVVLFPQWSMAQLSGTNTTQVFLDEWGWGSSSSIADQSRMAVGYKIYSGGKEFEDSGLDSARSILYGESLYLFFMGGIAGEMIGIDFERAESSLLLGSIWSDRADFEFAVVRFHDQGREGQDPDAGGVQDFLDADGHFTMPADAEILDEQVKIESWGYSTFSNTLMFNITQRGFEGTAEYLNNLAAGTEY